MDIARFAGPLSGVGTKLTLYAEGTLDSPRKEGQGGFAVHPKRKTVEFGIPTATQNGRFVISVPFHEFELLVAEYNRKKKTTGAKSTTNRRKKTAGAESTTNRQKKTTGAQSTPKQHKIVYHSCRDGFSYWILKFGSIKAIGYNYGYHRNRTHHHEFHNFSFGVYFSETGQGGFDEDKELQKEQKFLQLDHNPENWSASDCKFVFCFCRGFLPSEQHGTYEIPHVGTVNSQYVHDFYALAKRLGFGSDRAKWTDDQWCTMRDEFAKMHQTPKPKLKLVSG